MVRRSITTLQNKHYTQRSSVFQLIMNQQQENRIGRTQMRETSLCLPLTCYQSPHGEKLYSRAFKGHIHHRSHSPHVLRMCCRFQAHLSRIRKTNVIKVDFSCVMKSRLSHVDVQRENVQTCFVFAAESHLSLI